MFININETLHYGMKIRKNKEGIGGKSLENPA